MNTLYDLYINLKQSEFNIESYLNSLNYNKRGKTYEKVFMIYILSDCYEHYKLLDDNYEIIIDKQKYLHNNKIDNGCASGRVDIKILNTLTNEKILVSSKYYKQERSMDKYDIQKIYTYASNHNIQNYKIGLLIHNKHEFITKYNKSINDVKGEYGMTQMSIAIKYDNDDEGNKIIKAITSDKFKEFIKYNSWNGGFGFEYLIFTYLKKDFYKYFI